MNGLNNSLTFNFGVTNFAILKGSIPSQATLNGYTNPSTDRSSDILITFPLTNAVGVDNRATPGTPSYFEFIDTNDVAASASGTASWFWAYGSNGTGGGYPHVAGTITSTDVGTGDLLVNNTSIVSGQFYRLNTFRMTMPLTYTF